MWKIKCCLWLNTCFAKPANPGGRESERAYQEMQFRNAGRALEFYQRYVDFQGKDVLDLGCGIGGKTVYYALQSGARKVIGVDVVERFVRLAQEFAESQQASACVEFRVNARETLNLDSNTMDVIISNDAMEHVEAPRQILRECYRVLKPGGVVCLDFGPLYYSHNGAHIYDYINIPWCQLLFSQDTLIGAIKTLPPLPHAFGHDRTIERFTGLNKLTVRGFQRLLAEHDFDVVAWQVRREKRFKGVPVTWLSYVPGVGNLFRNALTCILRKPR